jgi:hypothetical protein
MSAGTHARSTTKIGSKNSLYPHNHFTEQLMGTFRKSLWESDLNQEPSSLLIQRLKNYVSLLPPHQNPQEKLHTGTGNRTTCAVLSREGQAKG